eukprot:1162147-Pelagomonas_calceolata.AAC.18
MASSLFVQIRNDQVAAGGAVLVFLPGAPEIGKAARALSGHQPLQTAAGGPQQLRIVSLYGSLSSQDQAKVFNRGHRGLFKHYVLDPHVNPHYDASALICWDTLCRALWAAQGLAPSKDWQILAVQNA